jgi:hypothetical protein
VFSNRGFAWKLGSGLAMAVLLGILSAKRGQSIHPELWRCLAEPGRWEGTPLRLRGVRVIESDAAGFDIDVQGSRARVVPAACVAPGDAIVLAGTFRAAGPLVQMAEFRKDPEPGDAVRLSEIASILVLAGVLLNLLRHFAFRPGVIQVHGVERRDPVDRGAQ